MRLRKLLRQSPAVLLLFMPLLAQAQQDDARGLGPAPGRPLFPHPRVTFAGEVFFAPDESALEARSNTELDGLLAKMAAVDVQSVIVVGHVDSPGSDVRGDGLSLRRAHAVKAYFVGRGIEASRILVFEARQPPAGNALHGARERRVEIDILCLSPKGLIRPIPPP